MLLASLCSEQFGAALRPQVLTGFYKIIILFLITRLVRGKIIVDSTFETQAESVLCTLS